ncbi:MAG TPA: zf-HC2 domain-containing protein, partial [Burkholderiaceae bacterium]
MIRHHPDDALLLGHAGGGLATGPALLVEAHLEGCARCRQAVRAFERVGGELLQAEPPQALAGG